MVEDRQTEVTRGSHRSRYSRLVPLGSAVVILAAAVVWIGLAGTGIDQERDPVRIERGNPGAVGTSGELSEPREADVSPGVIRDLETITGVNDGHVFVGRRVELQVPVSRHVNDAAFWVGSGDNRLLVVLTRESRDGATRQRGGPSTAVGLVPVGELAVVSGSIQQVPDAEAMRSWGLTSADLTELMDRRIFLRADIVSALAGAGVVPN
jgi:hypothetical protein